MRSRAIELSLLAAVSGCLVACGGDDGGEPDGNTAGSGGGTCPSFEACGGNPVGDWSIDSVCVDKPELFFATLVSQAACSTALKSTRDIDGTGTYELGADGMAVSSFVFTGTGVIEFNDACVRALGVAQSAASECVNIQTELTKQDAVGSATCSASGATCNCTVGMEQTLAGMSPYTVAGNNLKVDPLTQAFCAAGDKLAVQTTFAGVTLTLKFTK